MTRHAPLIVIGMHRSGTSAVVRALAGLGLFTGHDLEPNAEARFFLKLNEELLRMAGARWDAPASMQRLLQEPGLVDWLAKWLDGQLGGYGTRLYLSKPGWLRYRDVRNYPQPWGWKDPRNTLTLPVWLRLFPEARVVHVLRHGVDVAASLRARERQLLQRTLAAGHVAEAWRLTSPRCLDLAYGFNLWEQYMEVGEAAMQQLPPSQGLTLRFEEWLQAPAQHLDQLNNWLGLGAGEEQISAITATLRRERRFAFTRDAELVQFAAEVASASPWMHRYYPETNA